MPRPASWVSDLASRIASEVPRLLSSWMATNVSRPRPATPVMANRATAPAIEVSSRRPRRRRRMTPSGLAAGERIVCQEFGQISLLQQRRRGAGRDRVSHQLSGSRQCYDRRGLCSAISRRVASTPDTPGMARSITTTRGSSSASSHRLLAVMRRADQPQPGGPSQGPLERAPESRMVVDDEDRDTDRLRTDLAHAGATIGGTRSHLNWTLVLRRRGRRRLRS